MKKMSLTIKKLLELRSINGLVIIAGKTGLNKSIYNVNIIDNPDSFEWFNPGDFLISSGYFFKTSPMLQRRLVRQLAEKNCAGLGIKINRYWDKIPTPIIQECNKRGIPLITIPYNYSLSQIYNEINTEIYSRENSLLNRYKKIQEAFGNYSFEENEKENIIKTLVNLINNSVLLLDSEFYLLDYFEHPNEVENISNFLELNVRSRCFTSEFLFDIPKNIKKLPLNISKVFIKNEKEIICKFFPIVHSNTIYGYFVIWESQKKLEYLDLVAIKSASLFISLDRIKAKQIEEALIKEKENFFDDLIQNRIVSMNALKNLATLYGLNPENTYVIMTISLNNYDLQQFTKVTNILSEIAKTKNIKFKQFYKHSFIILFLFFQKSLLDKKILDSVKILAKDLEIALKKHKICFEKIVISSICKDFSELGKVVLTTFEILNLSTQINFKEKICVFNDIKSFYFLNNFIKKEDLKIFYNQVLGQLEEENKLSNNKFIETLDYYFQANQNIALASKLANIHRNTFLYRMEKIKVILEDDFNDSESLFNYQLALHIGKIIKK